MHGDIKKVINDKWTENMFEEIVKIFVTGTGYCVSEIILCFCLKSLNIMYHFKIFDSYLLIFIFFLTIFSVL